MALRVRNVGGPGLVVAVRGPGCLGWVGDVQVIRESIEKTRCESASGSYSQVARQDSN